MGKAIGRMRVLPWVLAGTLLLGATIPSDVPVRTSDTDSGASIPSSSLSGSSRQAQALRRPI